MKNHIFIISILLFILLLSNVMIVTASSSLWNDKAGNLYKDDDDYKMGDVITVIIEEATDAVQSANTNTSQDSSVGADAGTGIFHFLTSFGFGYQDEDKADGQTQRRGTIEADITTRIVNVLDNDNYEIQGVKKIKVNGEEQIIRLSGVIRKDDIEDDNSVSSKKIADASIEVEGQGVVTEKQRPNIFQRIFNWIF